MEIQLPIPIEETIKKRHSVRTYASQALSADDRKLLSRYMERLDNPFGVPVTMHIIDKALNAGGEKLGTYGIIKGATTFLGVSVPDVKYAPLAAGYTFENLILCATHMGLGTVWLAATFNRDAFSSAMDIPTAALFPAISPVGYPAAKPSITESLMRSAMKSSARKEWNALFFQADFVTPLTLEAASAYASALEMVRLAPSAKNAQPWRVRKDGNVYHFYVTYPPKLSRAEILIKQVDLGTLMELQDTTEQAGFRTIAAAAAIAEHSIAHQFAAGRPDAQDAQQLTDFAKQIGEKIAAGDDTKPPLPGNRPYKKASGIGLIPKPTKDCVGCGVCAAKCPMQAIDTQHPRKVDHKACISCMRCISVCPHAARKVNRVLLSAAGLALKKVCSERKACELFL